MSDLFPQNKIDFLGQVLCKENTDMPTTYTIQQFIKIINAIQLLKEDKIDLINKYKKSYNQGDLKVCDKYIIRILDALKPTDKEEGKNKGDKSHEIPTMEGVCLKFLLQLAPYLDTIPDLVDYYVKTENFLKDYSGQGGNGNGQGRKGDYETLVKMKTIIVSAYCQTGKSTLIIARAVKSVLLGYTPIILVRNLSADVSQLVKSLNQRIAEMLQMVKDAGIEDSINIDIITNLTGDRNQASLTKCLEKRARGMVVALTNTTQLGHIIDLTADHEMKFDLFIDEIDFVDYGTNSSGELCETAQMLATLKKRSHQSFAITATPLDAFFNDEDLKTANHFRMPFSDKYRGLPDVEVCLLRKPMRYKGLGAAATFEQFVKADENLMDFFRKIGSPYTRGKLKNKNQANLNSHYHANISLLKITPFTEAQITLGEGFHNLFPHTPVLVYNGDGIKIDYEGMTTTEIAGKTVRRCEFADITIQQALQYFKEHPEFVFKDILIIAGVLASRGISFTSSDYEWHLNDMYYIPSESATIPEMIQSAGRLCGNNRGKGHLHLHTAENVATQLYNGYHFTDELIEEAMIQPVIEAKEQEEEMSIGKKMLATDMEMAKFPKGRKMTNKSQVKKSDFSLKKGTVEGRKAIEEYDFKKVEPEEEVNSDEDYIPEEDNKDYQCEIPEDELIRLTKKMFPKWTNQEIKIANFMRELDPYKIYTKTEIDEYCEDKGILILKDLSRYKYYTKNGKVCHGFGMILKVSNNTYQLYPELVKEFKKYF